MPTILNILKSGYDNNIDYDGYDDPELGSDIYTMGSGISDGKFSIINNNIFP